jgi:hypothetical protein
MDQKPRRGYARVDHEGLYRLSQAEMIRMVLDYDRKLMHAKSRIAALRTAAVQLMHRTPIAVEVKDVANREELHEGLEAAWNASLNDAVIPYGDTHHFTCVGMGCNTRFTDGRFPWMMDCGHIICNRCLEAPTENDVVTCKACSKEVHTCAPLYFKKLKPQV